MGRRKGGVPVHGWFLVDKPLGISSAAAVAVVRRALNAAKAGHGGTLDPLATGVLPIALGEATKTVSYVMDGRKSYRFAIRWGERRSTDDAEGEVLETSGVRPSEEAIRGKLPEFIGAIDQVPPTFSAIKMNGERAYTLARAEVPVVLSPRTVVIERFELVECPDGDHAVFEVRSGKGAYMRSLARDLAVALGTVGHVSALRRISVGSFTESMAIPLDNVDGLRHSGALFEHVLPVGAALADIPALILTEVEARRLRHGQPIAALPVASRSTFDGNFRDAVFCAMTGGTPVALAQIRGGEIRPIRVLNL
jgi:tRNA pseudouridine55 synthase